MKHFEPIDHILFSLITPLLINIRELSKKDENRLERALKIIALILKNTKFLEEKDEDLKEVLLDLEFTPYEVNKILDYFNSNKITFSEEDFKDPIVYEYFRTIDKELDKD